MKDSDFNPALTTTTVYSTRVTSAVISSPWRISWRASDSSNSAAKFSSGGADVAVWVAVAMRVGAFRQCRVCARTLFLVQRGLVVDFRCARPAWEAALDGPCCVNFSLRPFRAPGTALVPRRSTPPAYGRWCRDARRRGPRPAALWHVRHHARHVQRFHAKDFRL